MGPYLPKMSYICAPNSHAHALRCPRTQACNTPPFPHGRPAADRASGRRNAKPEAAHLLGRNLEREFAHVKHPVHFRREACLQRTPHGAVGHAGSKRPHGWAGKSQDGRAVISRTAETEQKSEGRPGESQPDSGALTRRAEISAKARKKQAIAQARESLRFHAACGRPSRPRSATWSGDCPSTTRSA